MGFATGTGAGATAGGVAGWDGWAGVTAAGAESVGPLDRCAPVGFVTGLMGVVVRVLRVVDVRRRLAVRPEPDPAAPDPGTASEVVVTDASGTDEAPAAACVGDTPGTRRMPLGSPVRPGARDNRACRLRRCRDPSGPLVPRTDTTNRPRWRYTPIGAPPDPMRWP